MKILNRGLRINTNGENALEVNGVQIIDKDGKIYGDIHAAAGSIGETELANSAVTAGKIASDAVTTAKILNANVTAAKLAADSVETAKIKDGNVILAKLAAGITASHIVKYFVLGSTITTTAFPGLAVGDLIVSILANGTVTVATCAVVDTLPADPADTTYLVVFRATA